MRTVIASMALGAVAFMAAPSFAATQQVHPTTTAAQRAATPATPAKSAKTAHAPAAAHAVRTAHVTPVRAAAPARPVTRVAATHPAGRMVQARLSNGKIVTYNCSLAGNANKTACRT